MGFLDNFNAIKDLVADYKNADLNNQLLELQYKMFTLLEENQSLKNNIQNLQEQIALNEKLIFKSPFWYMDGDNQPYCSRCKEADNKLIHLVGPYVGSGEKYYCPNCKMEYYRGQRGWCSMT